MTPMAGVLTVRSKLLMLLAPFLRRWNYSRVAEQVRRRTLPPHPPPRFCLLHSLVKEVANYLKPIASHNSNTSL